MIFFADAAPMPGSDSRSLREAVFRSILLSLVAPVFSCEDLEAMGLADCASALDDASIAITRNAKTIRCENGDLNKEYTPGHTILLAGDCSPLSGRAAKSEMNSATMLANQARGGLIHHPDQSPV